MKTSLAALFQRTRPRTRRVVLLYGVLSVAIACTPAAPRSAPARPSHAPTEDILVFSDLHFNPFSDLALVDSLQRAAVPEWRAIFRGSSQQTYSAYGSDTNYPLLESALAAMQRAAPRLGLVLIAGDLLAHGFQSNFKKTARDTSDAALAAFTARTNEFLAREIAAAFPGAQIVPALGNNDSGCGDYMSEPRSAFLRSVAEAWQPLVNRRKSAPDFVAAFAVAGHYTAVSPELGARVVVLNDVYWSPRYSNTCGSSQAEPGREAFAWLNRVLADSRARGERVWLLTHAPVGVDVYGSLASPSVVTMLQPAYAADLVSTLQQFATTVQYGIYGHTHMNEFRVVSDANAHPIVASQGIPAVSPIFGNNPAFFVLALDTRSRAITDYTVYALTNLSSASANAAGVWSREYSLRETYGIDGLSAKTMAALRDSLATNASARASFIRFYDSGSGRAGLSSTNWQAYWCGIGNLDPASFTRCYRGPS